MESVPSTPRERTPACTPTSTSTSPPPAPTTRSAARPSTPPRTAHAVGSASDTGDVATRMMARSLVGRDTQLAQLEAALQDAAHGRPSFVFLAGEPGLGKTRLLDELIRRVRADGRARVLAGDCLALGEGELPYAPLVGALRPMARAGDPVLDALPATTRDALAALAPSLARGHRASLDDATGGPSAPSPQARVFEALLELVDVLAATVPVILILEDLHWADTSTRAFLRFLSVNLCRERVLVVGSFRPDELHRRHPLRPLLAELERDTRTTRIELEPLHRDELALQLADILGAPPDDDLLTRMHRRTEGNPLFTEELLAAGPDGRGGLPPTLRDALMVRVQRLSEDAQELLRLVAVARSVDHQTLAACAAVSGREMHSALREAIAAQILTVDDDERYRFRHALLREAVGDDLLPGERADLHLTLAQALQAGETSGNRAFRTAAVAHHFRQAGDQPAALRAAVRAADAAEEVHASGEAMRLLEHALELWDRVPDAAQLVGTTQPELLWRTARAAISVGDNARAGTLLARALELVGDSDPVLASHLTAQLARARWNLNEQRDTLSLLESSMALLPPGPSAHRAWRLALKARFLMLMGRYREAAEAGEAAALLARETDTPRAEASALNAVGVARAALGDVEAGARALREAEAIGRASGKVGDLARAAVNLADVLHLAGRSDEAIAVTEAALQEGEALGQHWSWLMTSDAEVKIATGRWAEAEARLQELGLRHQGTALLNVRLRHAELALVRGRYDVAAEHLDRAVRSARDSQEPQFIAVLYALLADTAIARGDLPAARAAVVEGLDRIEFCTDDVHRIVLLAATGVRVEAELAQHARDLHQPLEAAEAMERAGSLLERITAAVEDEDGGGRPVERAHWLTAGAEYGRAIRADDPAAWDQAAAAWQAVGRPYPAAQCALRAIEARVLSGDRERAARDASALLEAVEGLGAVPVATELRSLIARARLRTDTASPGPEDAAPAPADDDGAAPDAAEDPFGLTERERQVLALVAAGATNREVGATLFMAEKTASVHVSRILAKLDVRSRTEAAGVAHRLGLDEAVV